MNQQLERYLQTVLLILDLIILNLFYIFCFAIFNKNIGLFSHNTYLLFWTISNVLWIILSFMMRTYSEKIILSFEYFTKRTILVYLLWIISIMFYLFFSRQLELSRLFIVATIGSFGFGLLVNRFIYLGLNGYLKKSNYLIKKVLILGYNETAKKLAKYFEEDSLNTQLIGYIENEENIHELSNYPILAEINDTLKVAKESNVNEIFSTITPEQNKDIYNLMYQSEKECIRFKIVPNLSVFITREVHIEYFGQLPILSLRSEPLDDVGNRIKKRVLDIMVSLFVVIFILSWLVPILGVLIFIESGFPIFFKQLRTGKDKKPFYCLKFRSMKSNKDAHFKQATQNDERITKIGKLIRKTSLDEFPQFINVLRGEMSLVGPRPHMVKHTSDYSKLVDDYMVRQFIKPGITGWAQINGYRGEITNPEQIEARVNKDLWYLENWTLWLDIQILFLTLYQMFRGDKNAY
ncbi:undecaprenyl-phosphate glucose phosphotransferase [Ginsengibacter hankyongi]|uniref:Undecaprenyl-phosphate glucose phosphotransferase n=1 Tax=Ginsengibacter hankyongi TaxID=2607284 RepID=A0A5J5II92_9BACT|nr:undecaprenyl-phosphate glucose phosphotransferase [Ginsengibacter hankyongi]